MGVSEESTDLGLVEALRAFDVTAKTKDERAAAQRGGRVVLEQLQKLAPKIWQCARLGRAGWEDIISQVNLGLYVSNPVLRNPERSWTDGMVIRGFVIRLCHRAIDEFRRRSRDVALKDDQPISAPGPTAPDDLEAEEEQRLVDELRSRFYGEIVPEAAGIPGPPRKAAFELCIEMLRTARRKERTIEDCAREERDEKDPGAELSRVRDRLDKRNSRAREKLLTHIDDLLVWEAISEEEHSAFCAIVNTELRLRSQNRDSSRGYGDKLGGREKGL